MEMRICRIDALHWSRIDAGQMTTMGYVGESCAIASDVMVFPLPRLCHNNTPRCCVVFMWFTTVCWCGRSLTAGCENRDVRSVARRPGLR